MTYITRLCGSQIPSLSSCLMEDMCVNHVLIRVPVLQVEVLSVPVTKDTSEATLKQLMPHVQVSVYSQSELCHCTSI